MRLQAGRALESVVHHILCKTELAVTILKLSFQLKLFDQGR